MSGPGGGCGLTGGDIGDDDFTGNRDIMKPEKL
jgi:hypothetical protein